MRLPPAVFSGLVVRNWHAVVVLDSRREHDQFVADRQGQLGGKKQACERRAEGLVTRGAGHPGGGIEAAVLAGGRVEDEVLTGLLLEVGRDGRDRNILKVERRFLAQARPDAPCAGLLRP